jgi:hypothetical protein
MLGKRSRNVNVEKLEVAKIGNYRKGIKKGNRERKSRRNERNVL